MYVYILFKFLHHQISRFLLINLDGPDYSIKLAVSKFTGLCRNLICGLWNYFFGQKIASLYPDKFYLDLLF